MKPGYLLGALLLSPILAFANSDDNADGLIFSPLPQNKNTVVRHYSNEQEMPNLSQMAQRTIDFPTQIVRVSGNLTGLELSCDDVENEIDQVFSKKSPLICLLTTLTSAVAMMSMIRNSTRQTSLFKVISIH
ncbi:Lpg0189 family type II secretion system effector [Legionella pneumophila]|nr:Lpg0189 family type II secretion system effector [Legionella pneumophila]